MQKKVTREPIPWEHQATESLATWRWNTPHFVVDIFAEGAPSAKKVYNWKILDKSSGFPKPFDNGLAMNFNQAVDAIVEIIAKSYTRNLGYQAYAGTLATTYQINDGRKYDFAPALGENVVVKVLDENNNETTITGLFEIHHYDFIISVGESGIIVPPLKVLDVLREFGMTSLVKNNDGQVHATKNNRIFHEEWQKGCSGRPGFRPNTVQHGPHDKYCSIHGI